MLCRTLIAISLLGIACGDDAAVDGGFDSNVADGALDGAMDAAMDAAIDGAATDSGADGGSSAVAIRIVATGATFPHADGLGGQTARATVAGVRSLSLHQSMTDSDPLVLFQATGADVPVGYVPGDDTLVSTVDASALESGTYTFARLVHSYARYEVDATLHRGVAVHEGVVTSFQVIADDTVVDGETYDAGHFEFAFEASDATAEWTGEDAPFPDLSATPGALGVVEDGEWAVYFPIELTIDEVPTEDATLTIEVNMHEAFRWTDLLLLGYEADVFDVTDISAEPVVRFGGNSFELLSTL